MKQYKNKNAKLNLYIIYSIIILILIVSMVFIINSIKKSESTNTIGSENIILNFLQSASKKTYVYLDNKAGAPTPQPYGCRSSIECSDSLQNCNHDKKICLNRECVDEVECTSHQQCNNYRSQQKACSPFYNQQVIIRSVTYVCYDKDGGVPMQGICIGSLINFYYDCQTGFHCSEGNCVHN